MQHDDLVYVRHMLDMAELATQKVAGKSRASYDADEILRLALAHLVQTIGEAAARVSPDFRLRHPTIPWSRVIGMRHRIVHDYLDVNYSILWDVLIVDLPTLIEDLRDIAGSAG